MAPILPPDDGAGPAGPVAEHEPLRRFFKAFHDAPPRVFSEAFARHSRTVQKILDRYELSDIQVMPDGCLRCKQTDGTVIYRPAGFKGRG